MVKKIVQTKRNRNNFRCAWFALYYLIALSAFLCSTLRCSHSRTGSS